MRARIFEEERGSGGVSANFSLALVADISGLFCCEGESFMSRSSHQSNSVTSWMPDAVNHCLFRRGTKKWTLGCFALIFIMVGWSM